MTSQTHPIDGNDDCPTCGRPDGKLRHNIGVTSATTPTDKAELEVVAWLCEGDKPGHWHEFPHVIFDREQAEQRAASDWWTVTPLADLAQATTLLAAKDAEIERLGALVDHLRLEAQGHASEARTANSTIYEIYQVLSGSKGDSGNWHGAEPAREFVTSMENKIYDANSRTEAAEASLAKAVEVLTKISCPTQTEGLLWWQVEARAFLSEQKP